MSEREEKRYKLAWNEDKTQVLLVPDENGDIYMSLSALYNPVNYLLIDNKEPINSTDNKHMNTLKNDLSIKFNYQNECGFIEDKLNNPPESNYTKEIKRIILLNEIKKTRMKNRWWQFWK